MAYPVYSFDLVFPTAAWKTADLCREFASAFGCGNDINLQEISLPVSIRSVTKDEHSLTDELESIFSSTGPLRGILEGWKSRREFMKRYVTVELKKNRQLSDFAERLSAIPGTTVIPSSRGMMADICELRPFGLYFAIAEIFGFSLSGRDRILRLFSQNPAYTAGYARPPLLPVDITMIRVLKDGVPWKLYDLALHGWIETDHEGDQEYLAKSCRELRRARGYELGRGIACSMAGHEDPGPALSADLHLGHNGVINYYCRPFPRNATSEMDDVLINNWNASLHPDHPVWHLGDFTYKADSKTNLDYQKRLNGRISWIRGNHDISLPGAEDSAAITYEGIDFLLIHNPKHIPESWNGWVIHGHTHNNRLNEYPFFSGAGKTVNVSVEVTGYHPVYLSEIITLIRRFESGDITSDIMLRDHA